MVRYFETPTPEYDVSGCDQSDTCPKCIRLEHLGPVWFIGPSVPQHDEATRPNEHTFDGAGSINYIGRGGNGRKYHPDAKAESNLLRGKHYHASED